MHPKTASVSRGPSPGAASQAAESLCRGLRVSIIPVGMEQGPVGAAPAVFGAAAGGTGGRRTQREGGGGGLGAVRCQEGFEVLIMSTEGSEPPPLVGVCLSWSGLTAAPSPARAIPHRFPPLQPRGLSRSGKTAGKEWGRQEKPPSLLQFPQQGRDGSEQAALPEGGRAGVARDWSRVPVVDTDPVPLRPGLVARIFVPCSCGTDRGICGTDSSLAGYNHLTSR